MALAAGAAGCAGHDDPTRPQVQSGVNFAPGLQADVYQPIRGVGPLAAVVLVHPGGFVSGTRQDMGTLAETLAHLGYVAVTVDYRLSQGAWFPATTLNQPGLATAATTARDDVERAVDWLRAGGGRYHVDPARIAVVGYSAGAITALDVAADPAASISAAVSISGAAVDPTALASPHPPLLLLHGDADAVIPAALADATCAVAVAGGRCDVFHYGTAGHDLPSSVDAPDVVGRINRFLQAVAETR